jgi:DNA-binding Xre family transcriptional regulator
MSVIRRSAEGWVSEDWAAVATAITRRLSELGLSQRDLTERAQVSKATVRELQYDTVQRRRSTRTLEALSVALDWHPDHLAAVLANRRPPTAGEPKSRPEGDLPGRLSVVEDYLREILARLDGLGDVNTRLDELQSNIDALHKRLGGDTAKGGT